MMSKRLFFALILCLGLYFTSNASPIGPFKGVKTVVIDAGHGGKDPGCHGVKFKEKEVALAVALELGKQIVESFKDVKVIYTRTTDVFVELSERARIANRANADIFICIHANASENKSAYGSETYVMGLHKTKGNLNVAKRENASILLEDDYEEKYEGFDPNSDEGNILMMMYQNIHLEQSLKLAASIQSYYKQSERKDKGVKQAGFLVLWKTAMPSVLTEMGFLTNPEEEKYLGSKEGQKQIATGIFNAFKDYKKDLDQAYKEEEGSVKKDVIKEEPKDPPVKNDEPDKMESFISAEDQKGIAFRVQIITSSVRLSPNDLRFEGLKDVVEYEAGGLYKYAVGDFSNKVQADFYQEELRGKGFKDAFLVAFKDGKRIPLNDALNEVKH